MPRNKKYVYICSPKTTVLGRENGASAPRATEKERCRSGRSGRTRNAVYGQLYRGFESLSLRNKGCKSSICEIYTLFYTQECKIGCFCIFKDSSKECQLQSDWYFYGLAEWTFMTKNIVIQKNKYLKYGIHLPKYEISIHIFLFCNSLDIG